MSELSDLLIEREIRGLRGALIARAILAMVGIALVLLVSGNRYELFISTAACLAAAAIAALLVYLLGRVRSPVPIGIAAVAIDVGLMIGFPVIWLTSVGGADAVPLSFTIKGGIATVMIVFIVLNAVSLRPLYPALATVGAVTVYLGLVAMVASDPRVQFTRDYLEASTGPSVNSGLLVSNLVLIALVGAGVCLITVQARRLTIDGVRLEKANAQLGRYFSPAVRDQISDAGSSFLEPGGKEQEVAVLFCDIRGFTRLSESMKPHEVMQLLSDYHSLMVAAVFANGGTLDKFIGDAVMATFGTPLPKPDDTRRAVKAGIAMRSALAEFNRQRSLQHLASIRHGIGIHVGAAIVGNVGTPERLEYTVIGDTVNVASRIASACKKTGDDLLISRAVKERLDGSVSLRFIDPTSLPGKSEPVDLFAVD